MNNFKITNEDYELIRKFETIRNRGFYADGKQVTDVYNRVLGKKLPSTNCSSCISHRIAELVDAANRFKKQMELSGMTSTSQLIDEIKGVESEIKPSESINGNEPTTIKEDENKALTEAEKMKEKMAKVRSHRKKKS